MSTRPPSNLPMALSTARRQFDRWRSGHRPRARLPQELWHKAVALAGEYGLNKTASALVLKYYSLKKRVDVTAVEASERGMSLPRIHAAGGRAPQVHGLFGATTETTRKVMDRMLDKAEKEKASGDDTAQENATEPRQKAKRHGRNGAAAYVGEERQNGCRPTMIRIAIRTASAGFSPAHGSGVGVRCEGKGQEDSIRQW